MCKICNYSYWLILVVVLTNPIGAFAKTRLEITELELARIIAKKYGYVLVEERDNRDIAQSKNLSDKLSHQRKKVHLDNDSFYLKGAAGIINLGQFHESTIFSKSKPASTESITIGKNLNRRFSTGLELIKSGKVRLKGYDPWGTKGNSQEVKIGGKGVFGVLQYNLLCDDSIKHYIKAGIGGVRNTPSDLVVLVMGKNYVVRNKASNNVAWKIGAGLNININDYLSTEIEYNYTDRGKVNLSGVMDSETTVLPLHEHAVTLGVVTQLQ